MIGLVRLSGFYQEAFAGARADMNIIIPNYEILNFDVGSLIVSDTGVSKVHSQPMLEVLRELKLSRVMTKLEFDELLAKNGLDNSGAFEFLERIIPVRSVESIYFERTVIFHSWEGRIDIEGLLRDELPGHVEFNLISDSAVESVKGLRCFIVLLCDPYDYKGVKELYFDLARASPPKCYLRMLADG